MTSALHMDFIIMIALLDSSVSQTENPKYKDFLVIDIKASQVQLKVLLRSVLLPPWKMWRNLKCLRWDPFWLYCASR